LENANDKADFKGVTWRISFFANEENMTVSILSSQVTKIDDLFSRVSCD